MDPQRTVHMFAQLGVPFEEKKHHWKSRAIVACPICKRLLSRKTDLTRHMKRHDPNIEALKHKCPYANCKYSALQKSNLKTHMNQHTGEKPNKCRHIVQIDGEMLPCKFASSDPGALTRHRKRWHGYVPRSRALARAMAENNEYMDEARDVDEQPLNLFTEEHAKAFGYIKQEPVPSPPLYQTSTSSIALPQLPPMPMHQGAQQSASGSSSRSAAFHGPSYPPPSYLPSPVPSAAGPSLYSFSDQPDMDEFYGSLHRNTRSEMRFTPEDAFLPQPWEALNHWSQPNYHGFSDVPGPHYVARRQQPAADFPSPTGTPLYGLSGSPVQTMRAHNSVAQDYGTPQAYAWSSRASTPAAPMGPPSRAPSLPVYMPRAPSCSPVNMPPSISGWPEFMG